MASRGIRFFATPEEMAEWVKQLASCGEYKFAGEFWPSVRLKSAADKPYYDRVAAEELSPADFWPDRLNVSVEDGEPITSEQSKAPGENCIISLDLPRLTDGALHMAVLGAKSDWWDSEDQVSYHNPDTIELFNKVAKQLRPMLIRGVTGKDIKGGNGHYYRDLSYTEAVHKLTASGKVELMQNGVANVRFYCGDAKAQPRKGASSKLKPKAQ